MGRPAHRSAPLIRVEASHPTAEASASDTIKGPSLMERLRKYYNNAYDNMGNYDSFVWYGPR